MSALGQANGITARDGSWSRSEGFCVATAFHDRDVHVSLIGELDQTQTVTMEHAFGVIVAGNAGRMTIELSELQFLDSAGTRELLSWVSRCEGAGWTIALVNPSAPVRRLMALAIRNGDAPARLLAPPDLHVPDRTRRGHGTSGPSHADDR